MGKIVLNEGLTGERLESNQFGFNGYIGGIRKVAYWTPDGRCLRAVPNIREYVIKDKDGKVIESGSRDANLDKGWLLQKPQVLKLFCQTCDGWHDTPAEIKKCEKVQKAKLAVFERRANAEMGKNMQDKDFRINALEGQIAELKEMMSRLSGEAKK